MHNTRTLGGERDLLEPASQPRLLSATPAGICVYKLRWVALRSRNCIRVHQRGLRARSAAIRTTPTIGRLPPPPPTVATLVHLTGIGKANSHTWRAKARHSYLLRFFRWQIYTHRYIHIHRYIYTHVSKYSDTCKYIYEKLYRYIDIVELCATITKTEESFLSWDRNTGTQLSTLRQFWRCVSWGGMCECVGVGDRQVFKWIAEIMGRDMYWEADVFWMVNSTE